VANFFPTYLATKTKQSDSKSKPTLAELEKLDCEMLEQIKLAELPFSKDEGLALYALRHSK
jgi:hypothetical protein